jgi:arginyl-tRNA synthetase
MNDSIVSYLSHALSHAIATKFPNIDTKNIDIVIEKPKQKAHGDVSSPIAMTLAKLLKANPIAIARDIMADFPWDSRFIEPDPELTHTIAGAFINFRFSHEYLHTILTGIAVNPDTFGKNIAETPKKMLFEYVSANPTGPMVVVNGRAAAIGDVMVRINTWIGHSVQREFYVNDYGNQVILLGKSMEVRYQQEKGIEGTIPEGGYEGDYVKDMALTIAAQHPDIDSLPQEQRETLFMNEALETLMAQQKAILADYGVKYDRWFRESQLHASGAPQRVLNLLREQQLTYIKDGAEWFLSTKFGDEKDRALVRSSGTPTYFLADLSYHLEKASRGFDESYTFWGPDHHGYIPRLEHAVNALNLHKTVFKNFIIQQVNLIRDGQPFRMSKRKGDFITISDLLENVTVDAARYFFVMRRLSTHFDFDMSLAIKQSDENPVFYIQYAHARTCSLIRHAEERGFTMEEILAANPAILIEPEALDVIKAIAEFPGMLLYASQYVEPHRVTAYLENCASVFHHFYQIHRIVTDDRAASLARLFLTVGVRNALRTALAIIGVSAPDRM